MSGPLGYVEPFTAKISRSVRPMINHYLRWLFLDSLMIALAPVSSRQVTSEHANGVGAR